MTRSNKCAGVSQAIHSVRRPVYPSGSFVGERYVRVSTESVGPFRSRPSQFAAIWPGLGLGVWCG